MIKSLLLEDNETVAPKLPLHPEGLIGMRTENIPQQHRERETDNLNHAILDENHRNAEEENILAKSSNSSIEMIENKNAVDEEKTITTSLSSSSTIDTSPPKEDNSNRRRDSSIFRPEEGDEIQSTRMIDIPSSRQNLYDDHVLSEGNGDSEGSSSEDDDDDGSSISSGGSTSSTNSSTSESMCSSSSSVDGDSSSSVSADEMSTIAN